MGPDDEIDVKDSELAGYPVDKPDIKEPVDPPIKDAKEVVDKKPASLRETIDQAISEVKERNSEKPDNKAEKPVKKVSTDEVDEIEPIEKEVQENKSDIPVPVSWSKEAKDTWSNLPPATQAAISKREKEFSDGIKQYADKAKKYDEFDQFIAPHRNEIAAYRVTESQFIGALLQRFKAISHPDPNYKAAAFKALAKDFGVDVTQFTPKEPTQQNSDGQDIETTPYATDPNVLNELNSLKQMVNGFVQNTQQQQQYSTQLWLQEWAKDKPFYEKVRQDMAVLLQSGSIPLKEGNFDLDAAYNKAVRMNDEVWKEYQQKEKEALDAKRKEEAAKKAAAVQKAKQASVSLRPNAPSSNLKVNGNQSKSQSIRDSIMSAVKEVRGD